MLKLLLIVVGLGMAVKFGVLDQIGTLARDAALQGGATPDQVLTASSQVQSLLSLDGFGTIMDMVGALPPPFGTIGKPLFLLVLVGMAVSVAAGALASLVRALRWMRDLAV